jgi:long-chain acyl-CoA synthetase
VQTLVASLQRLAAERAGRRGLEDAAGALSFGQCWAAVQGGAQWLAEQGVRPGDRVALFGSNSVRFALAYFAVHAARAIAVPMGNDLSAHAARSVLEECRPSMVLAENPEAAPTDIGRAMPHPADWSGGEDGHLPACLPGDPADLLFTTGTTGRKKGVLLTHANISAAATNINAFLRPRMDDVEVVPIPLSHSFGLGRLRCWAQIGQVIALEPGLRNPALLYKRLIELKATGLAIVPAGVAILRRLIKDRFSDAGRSLRYVELGSAPLAEEDRAWLLAMLPQARICHHYGLTEASRAAFRELHADAARSSSIGRASPNVEIMIGGEDGLAVPIGEPGEILVRGGMVMQGYWDQPELSAEVLQNGWLRTGDEGWADSDGYLYLRGRRGDIINVGGLKVAPQEVEQRLREIAGVRDAACIGVADPRGILGQVVKAFIVCDETPDEARIIEALRAKLPEHEVPRLFEQVAELPKTDSGKLKRAELRVAVTSSGK